jgi:hypothetical protein
MTLSWRRSRESRAVTHCLALTERAVACRPTGHGSSMARLLRTVSVAASGAGADVARVMLAWMRFMNVPVKD